MIGGTRKERIKMQHNALNTGRATTSRQPPVINRISISMTRYASGSIFSMPPIYGRSTSGMVMEPSAFW